MADYNKVILLGRLVRYPTLKESQSGTAISEFTLAVNYTNAGRGQDETIFVDVTAWGGVARACAKTLARGSPVLVDGRLRQEKWKTRDGQKRSKLSVTANNVMFLEKKKDSEVPDEEEFPF